MRAGAVRRVGAGRAPPRGASWCLVLSLYVSVRYVGRVDVCDCMARLHELERSTPCVDRSVVAPGYF